MCDKAVLRAALVVAGVVAMNGCGQKGPLLLPDTATEVVTRPTQTQSDSAPPPAAKPEEPDDTEAKAPDKPPG